MNVKALVPGIAARAARAGLTIPRADAEAIAEEMLGFASYEDRLALLDECLSSMYDAYHLHLFLTKRPDYQVTING